MFEIGVLILYAASALISCIGCIATMLRGNPYASSLRETTVMTLLVMFVPLFNTMCAVLFIWSWISEGTGK